MSPLFQNSNAQEVRKITIFLPIKARGYVWIDDSGGPDGWGSLAVWDQREFSEHLFFKKENKKKESSSTKQQFPAAGHITCCSVNSSELR